MHILIIATRATHGGGGLQRQVQLQSAGLVARGHQVTLLQEQGPSPAGPDMWSHVRLLEVPSARTRLHARLGGIVFLLRGAVAVVRCGRDADVVYAQQLYSPTVLGAVLARLFGVPLIVRVTASGVTGEVAELRRIGAGWLRRWAFAAVDRLIVLTEAMGEETAELGFLGDRVRVVPNAVGDAQGVADAHFTEPQATHVQPTGHGIRSTEPERTLLRVLYLGRLSSEKRLDVLIGAVGRLHAAGRAVHLDLVGGPGGDRDVTEALQQQVDAAKLGGVVSFAGHVDDVSALLRQASVFVLVSASEGMSNALLEAMAHGVACIVSDTPENRATAAQHATYVPVGDDEALAEALAAAADARTTGVDRNRSAAMLEHVRTHHSVTHVTQAVEAIFHEVVQPRPNHRRARS